jgi:hypothetical protein
MRGPSPINMRLLYRVLYGYFLLLNTRLCRVTRCHSQPSSNNTDQKYIDGRSPCGYRSVPKKPEFDVEQARRTIAG